MSRRSTAYPGVGARVTIPSELWRRTIDELRSYALWESEALVFWSGIVSERTLQVTGLCIVRHPPQGGRVRLTSQESRWLVRRLRERDEKLVAQVHSHPGDAFHSPGDDERPASFHEGYLSIVVPRFAIDAQDLADAAVFEFDGFAFRPLTADDVRSRLFIQPLIEERRARYDGAPDRER